MPMFQQIPNELNAAFTQDRIDTFARGVDGFAPGKPLDPGLLLEEGTALHRMFSAYLDSLPGSFRETLRGVLHYALSCSPPKAITFAWTPAYDFEMNIWEQPCGITLMFRSRYPADRSLVRTDGKD